MTDDKQAREFWIDSYENNVHKVGIPFFGGKSGREEMPYIHVIEYHAYQQLKEEVSLYKGPRLTSAGQSIKYYQEQNKVLRELLKDFIKLSEETEAYWKFSDGLAANRFTDFVDKIKKLLGD